MKYTIHDLNNGSYIIILTVGATVGQIWCEDRDILDHTIKDIDKIKDLPTSEIIDEMSHWDNGDIGQIFEHQDWWIEEA